MFMSSLILMSLKNNLTRSDLTFDLPFLTLDVRLISLAVGATTTFLAGISSQLKTILITMLASVDHVSVWTAMPV